MSDIEVPTGAIQAASLRFAHAPSEVSSTRGTVQGGYNRAEVGFACDATVTGPFGQLWSAWSGALDRVGEQMKAPGVLLGLAAKAYEDAEHVCVSTWVPAGATPPPV